MVGIRNRQNIQHLQGVPDYVSWKVHGLCWECMRNTFCRIYCMCLKNVQNSTNGRVDLVDHTYTDPCWISVQLWIWSSLWYIPVREYTCATMPRKKIPFADLNELHQAANHALRVAILNERFKRWSKVSSVHCPMLIPNLAQERFGFGL